MVEEIEEGQISEIKLLSMLLIAFVMN